MSEYQYCEFLALYKALTSRQREELGQLSTRAEITATLWGANQTELVERGS